MKIGILSDTHDNIEDTKRAFSEFKEKGVSEIIHCGDFCAPFMIEIFDDYDLPVHAVFGNIDDRFRTTRNADSSKNVKLHGEAAILPIGGRMIVVNHYPNIAGAFAHSGNFDLVCYGHTHKKYIQKVSEKTTLLNPGEIMGRFGVKTYAVYDTESNNVEFFELK